MNGKKRKERKEWGKGSLREEEAAQFILSQRTQGKGI